MTSSPLRLDAAAYLAGAELYLDRYEEAGAHAERAMAVGLATGQSEFIPLPYSILGQVKLLRGQLAEASEMLDNAVEGARLSGTSRPSRETWSSALSGRSPRVTSTWRSAPRRRTSN